MPKVTKKIREPKSNITQGYCRMCQKSYAASRFYEATNPMIDKNGLMSVCRDHCNEIYQHYFSIYNNVEIALNYTCRDLDVRLCQDALKQTQSHIENLLSKGKPANAVFGYYKSKLSSTSKNNTKIEDYRYKDSDDINQTIENKDLYSDLSDECFTESDFEATDLIKKYWGQGKDSWEYEFLEENLYKLKTDFECPDYGMEMIMKDICFINLEIERIRQKIEKGDSRDISRLIESRGKLMNDGNLKPVQSTGADKNEKVSFGVLVKKWENEKPVEKRMDSEMKRYIDTYMIGHLAKMEGLNNEFTQKYDEAINDFTLDLEEIKSLGDDE